MRPQSPIIIHVPHASTFIPSEEWHTFVTSELQREIICMTDHYCDDLFLTEHEMVCFPVSRLVCDVERFRDDSREVMSNKGMGAVYSACSDGSLLRNIRDLDKERILTTYYDVHHRILNLAVRKRIKEYGKCLIIDGHSFFKVPLPHENDKALDRPDFCIGTDDFHTPGWIRERLTDYFMHRGYSVKVDSPFAGTMVPETYYRKDERVMSVMIEINRGLYINDDAVKNGQYEMIKAMIHGAIDEVSR